MTGPRALIAAMASEPTFWLVIAAVMVIAIGLACLSTGSHDYPRRNPGDDQAEYRDVSRLDAIDFAARGELHCLDDADDWRDDPANRADIARTRRQQHGRRQMRDIWTGGGGSDAA